LLSGKALRNSTCQGRHFTLSEHSFFRPLVRYEPDTLLAISNPDSEAGWIVTRFLNAAERYFPHLLLNWVFEKPMYFS
jgi:hypothetical protein